MFEYRLRVVPSYEHDCNLVTFFCLSQWSFSQLSYFYYLAWTSMPGIPAGLVPGGWGSSSPLSSLSSSQSRSRSTPNQCQVRTSSDTTTNTEIIEFSLAVSNQISLHRKLEI